MTDKQKKKTKKKKKKTCRPLIFHRYLWITNWGGASYLDQLIKSFLLRVSIYSTSLNYKTSLILFILQDGHSKGPGGITLSPQNITRESSRARRERKFLDFRLACFRSPWSFEKIMDRILLIILVKSVGPGKRRKPARLLRRRKQPMKRPPVPRRRHVQLDLENKGGLLYH